MYVRNKEKVCADACNRYGLLPQARFHASEETGGIHRLPQCRSGINGISPEKDVEYLTAVNQDRVAMNEPGLRSLHARRHTGHSRPLRHFRKREKGRGHRQKQPCGPPHCAYAGQPAFRHRRHHQARGDVIIDIGINRRENGRLCGDVDYDNVAPLASAIPPCSEA